MLTLLLKVVQSAACSCPVFTEEARGRFRVNVFPEMLPLNIVPAVPVARVVIVFEAEAKPRLEVATRLYPPLELPNKIWFTVGVVEVPVPPFATGRTPETSEDNEACPLAKEPATDLTKPEPKVENVVEPLAPTLMREEPEEELMVNKAPLCPLSPVISIPALPCVVSTANTLLPLPLVMFSAVEEELLTVKPPNWDTLKSEAPEEEEILKGIKEPLPCMLNVTADELAFTPATVPLSTKIPGAVVVAPVKRTT